MNWTDFLSSLPLAKPVLLITRTNRKYPKQRVQIRKITQGTDTITNSVIQNLKKFNFLNFDFFRKFKLRLLCISTSKRVLRTPFAGGNRLSYAKTTFSVTNGTNKKKLKESCSKSCKTCSKRGGK